MNIIQGVRFWLIQVLAGKTKVALNLRVRGCIVLDSKDEALICNNRLEACVDDEPRRRPAPPNDTWPRPRRPC